MKFLIVLISVVLWAKCVYCFKFEFVKEFTFPESTNPQDTPASEPLSDGDEGLLARQLIVGTVPPTTSPISTCICVPTGQCPNNQPTDGSGQIDIRIVNTPPQPTTAPPAPATCQAGLVRCCLPGPYRCGVRYPPVAGSQAPQAGQAPFGAYPWQAAILTTADVYLGSGALIDRRHVLTTAHKVNNLATTAFKVRLGEWDASSTREPIQAQDLTIARVFIHPGFNANNLQNDVAVIRLSTDVVLGRVPTIATVCLPTTAYTNQRCYVSGWGKNAFAGSYQAILREVDVPIRTAAECQTTLSTTRLGTTFVFNSASFICAGGETGKDACTGDGGSPLVCMVNGQWYVAGLVAWGIGCANGGVPGVYVNVLSYLAWIQSSINAA